MSPPTTETFPEEPLAPWNFTWIIKRELAIMGYPKSEGNIRYLEEQGVGHLVSLSPEKQPPFELFPRTLKWTPIDVLEFEPPSLEQILAFINICRETLVTGKAVGVHCRMGKGRSGVMAACYMVFFYDMPPENAVTHIRLTSHGSIETYQQEKAVKQFFDYVRSVSPPPTPPPTEDDEIRAMMAKYNPDTFRPNTQFDPRPLTYPTLEKYATHMHGCTTARRGRKSFLPHRTQERHHYLCDKLNEIPPPRQKLYFYVHRD